MSGGMETSSGNVEVMMRSTDYVAVVVVDSFDDPYSF